jgi:hypothetical protein
MGKAGSVTPAMRSLFTADVTGADQACVVENDHTGVEHSTLLAEHPYTLSPNCIQAMKLYATNKHTTLVDEIATGSKHDKAGATAAFADKIKIITGALATIQIVVNHTMLKSLGELLTPVKKGGLVLPKLHLSCAEHYEAQELKLPENRRPHSSHAQELKSSG